MESLELRKILIKGLKVNYARSCNKRIERILENKDKDTLEDLLQDLELMNLEGKTSKEMYSYINHYFYEIKKEDKATVEIIVQDQDQDQDEDEEENNAFDKIAYINYISSNNYVEKQSFSIDELNLTDKQKEILNIYATTNSMQKTADFLGVAKGTVQNTIQRLRKKLELKTA